MKLHRWKLCVLALCLALAACKTDLYAGLPESEGNQMLALLRANNIDAEKVVEKGGTIALRVERNAFVNAVELMRQNGFPKRKSVTMNDVFPSGQLVTSPAQERAKMVFLKEQQLESMLSSMDGVITASVSIAQATDDAGKRAGVTSAAVFVKYSPEVNVANREAEIRRLVLDSVPEVAPERISVVLQPAMFRYVESPSEANTPDARAVEWVRSNAVLVASAACVMVLLLTFGVALVVRAIRRKPAA